MKTLKTFLMTLIFAVGLAISTSATTHTVYVTSQPNYSLTPSNLTVTVGDTVKFVNYTSGSNVFTGFKTNTTIFGMSPGGGSYLYVVSGSDYPLITLKSASGSVTFGTIIVQNAITTSIKNIDNDVDFNIFPNPVINELNIKSKDNIGKISLIDINGKLISDVFIDSNTAILDMSVIPNGIYFIRVKNSTKKIIKY